MNLYTRCPHCETTFRVTTQQLQASGGQVRCGQCKQVFDAFATLTAQAPQSVVAEAGSPAPPVRAAGKDAEGPAPRTKDRPDPAASLYEWEFRTPEFPRRTGLWVSLSLLLAVLLAAQAVYAFRTELMVMVPQAHKYYVQACDWLGCSVAPPRLSSFLHIEASDLKAVDPARPNEIELLALVRSRAPIELAYPAFELTLTNERDQTIARRVFLPSEYLANAGAAGGLGAGGELPIRLFLDTGGLRAAGYRLYLFYP